MSTFSSPGSEFSYHTAPELASTSPASTTPSVMAPELSYASQRSVPTLLGKSNFGVWHASIDPILLSNEQAHSLVSGTWFEPRSPPSSSSLPTSPTSLVSITSSPSQTHASLYTILHAHSLSRTSLTTHQAAHRAYEHANLTVTRFIRGTLAINVIPFVRQHASAKGLYEQLIYLYGERAGIDMFGGPTMNMALQSRRMTHPSISRISEEGDTSPILPVINRRATNKSFLGYDIDTRFSPTTPTNTSLNDPTIPEQKQQQQKKRAAFKFPNSLSFRRFSKDKEDTAIILSPTTRKAVSPTTQRPPASSFHNNIHTLPPSQSAPATPYPTSPTQPFAPTTASSPAHDASTTSVSDTLATGEASVPSSSTSPKHGFSFDFPSSHPK